MRPRSVLLTSTCLGMFSKKYQKSLKNPPETHPKSKKNRRKIKKNLKKWMAKAKMSAENQKMREKCEKSAKSDPTWPPNQKSILASTGYARPSLYSVRSVKPTATYENPFKQA